MAGAVDIRRARLAELKLRPAYWPGCRRERNGNGTRPFHDPGGSQDLRPGRRGGVQAPRAGRSRQGLTGPVSPGRVAALCRRPVSTPVSIPVNIRYPLVIYDSLSGARAAIFDPGGFGLWRSEERRVGKGGVIT